VQVIHCIENGIPLLIESLPEEIDAVLDPVIQKKVGSAWLEALMLVACRCVVHAGVVSTRTWQVMQ
jgi:hypothetical protein